MRGQAGRHLDFVLLVLNNAQLKFCFVAIHELRWKRRVILIVYLDANIVGIALLTVRPEAQVAEELQVLQELQDFVRVAALAD